MAETFTPKIVLATVERTDGRLGETRVLEHQRAIRASVPAQPAGIKVQGVRRVYSFAAAKRAENVSIYEQKRHIHKCDSHN
jgi:hypothetical protein